jgi:16S rRNA (guanine(966)-N(2))-methyltransferase RsmD
MPIRVIAGSAKGRRLKLVPGDSTRPVMDRVKEALFSILGRSIIGSNFLDLFAGTGSVGIEALSRGAKYALFVEVDRLALKTIHENLAMTKLSEQAEVRRIDAFDLLKKAPSQHFDFIYVAPPQFHDVWVRALQSLDANPRWIPPGTVVIVQIAPTEQKVLALERLKPYDERRYGNTLLWFFEAIGEDE